MASSRRRAAGPWISAFVFSERSRHAQVAGDSDGLAIGHHPPPATVIALRQRRPRAAAGRGGAASRPAPGPVAQAPETDVEIAPSSE